LRKHRRFPYQKLVTFQELFIYLAFEETNEKSGQPFCAVNCIISCYEI